MLPCLAAPGSTGASFSCYSISAELPLVSSNSVKALASLSHFIWKKTHSSNHRGANQPRNKVQLVLQLFDRAFPIEPQFVDASTSTLQSVFQQRHDNQHAAKVPHFGAVCIRRPHSNLGNDSAKGDHVCYSREKAARQNGYAAWNCMICHHLFQPNCINALFLTHESILESEVRQNPSHHHLASLRCCWVSLSSSASEISPGQATESESISTSTRSTNSRSMHNPTTVNKSLHPTGLWHMMIWCMMY